MDCKYSTAPTPELIKERSALQTEFDLLTTHYTEQLLLQSRSNLYEHSDKAGKVLVQQIRQFTPSTLITCICKYDDDQISNDEQKINNELKVSTRLELFYQSTDLLQISESFME